MRLKSIIPILLDGAKFDGVVKNSGNVEKILFNFPTELKRDLFLSKIEQYTEKLFGDYCSIGLNSALIYTIEVE